MMNVITGSPHSNQLSVVTSYRGISDYHGNKMVITTSAMKELYGDLNFQQIRFHCRKHSVGRTFHVVTVANNSGNAVVQYFSGLTDALPDFCGSYVRMEDDDSRMAKQCFSAQWSSRRVKEEKSVKRVYDNAVQIPGKHFWNLTKRKNFECDDYAASQSSGDFWKVFVR